MENLCYFVNSRGILKSCDFHSNNPKSSCNDDKKYLFYMLLKMFDGMSIYVCSELLSFFVSDILLKIKKRFVLVSGDSDLSVPKEALTLKEFNKLTNNSFLIKWYAQNTQMQNINKIIQLPIGLDYHTISNNQNHPWKLENENHLPGAQEKVLVNIKENVKPFYERIPKIYVNFSLTNDRFGHRDKCIKTIPKNLLIINNVFLHRTNTWLNITNYTFVLSPFGNGMDCHRTWETLCLGSIPIVKAQNFSKLFEDLPVLIVNNWSDINQELLDNTITNFKSKKFNYNKLKLQYWINKIKEN
jgi:hypothetical protein